MTCDELGLDPAECIDVTAEIENLDPTGEKGDEFAEYAALLALQARSGNLDYPTDQVVPIEELGGGGISINVDSSAYEVPPEPNENPDSWETPDESGERLPTDWPTTLTVDVVDSPIDTTFPTPNPERVPFPWEDPTETLTIDVMGEPIESTFPTPINPKWIDGPPVDYVTYEPPTTEVPQMGLVNIGGLSVDFPSIDIPGIGPIGFTSSQTPPARTLPAPLLSGGCPPGYHRVVRRGPGGIDILKRDVCTKRRRMNMCNSHALRRATRRVAGFFNLVKGTEKHVRHALSSSMPKHHTMTRKGGCYTCGRPKRSCQC